MYCIQKSALGKNLRKKLVNQPEDFGGDTINNSTCKMHNQSNF